MKPIWKFRLFAFLAVLLVGAFSISNLAAEFIRPIAAPLPSRTSVAATPDQVSSSRRASAITPFRSDLKAEYAIALAGQTLKSEDTRREQADDAAQGVVKSALKIGPHDSRMWLVLALLQMQRNIGDSGITESLKMSYLTGPIRAELIPIRLDAVTLHQALNDADLKELARGDVRVVLTEFPNQRPLLVDDYARASSIGKAFIVESARMFDPKFADSLQAKK